MVCWKVRLAQWSSQREGVWNEQSIIWKEVLLQFYQCFISFLLCQESLVRILIFNSHNKSSCDFNKKGDPFKF